MRYVLLFLFVGTVSLVQAQRPNKLPVSLSVKAEYDSYFGVYPSFSVNIPLDSLRLLTVYSTVYTQAASRGLEAGVSLIVSVPKRRVSISPTVSLISGSYFLSDQALIVGEGFLSSLTVEKTKGRLSLQSTLAYYGALRRKTAATYDFGFYQLTAGWQVGSRLTVGVLHERFLTVRLPRNDVDVPRFQLVRSGFLAQGQLPGDFELQIAGGWLGSSFIRVGVSRSFSMSTNRRP